MVARARTACSRILLVAEDSDSLNCYRATGAAGVLHRGVSASNFLEAVRQIRMGADFVLPTDGARRLELCACLPESLTAGELKILSLLLEGFKNRRIAEYLDVAEHVVRGRFQKIFDKTGFSSRLELALFLSRECGREASRLASISVLGRARKIGEVSKAVGIARMGVLGPQEIQFGLLSGNRFEADRAD